MEESCDVVFAKEETSSERNSVRASTGGIPEKSSAAVSYGALHRDSLATLLDGTSSKAKLTPRV